MHAREWLCLWYLRLNGYFTLPNFVAHGRRGPLTEIDVLGARFPFSHEFPDDPKLQIPREKIDIVLAEAKGREIRELNGPWSSPDKGAIDYVLRRVGIVPQAEVKSLAREIYSHRVATLNECNVRVIAFADSIASHLLSEGVHFISWSDVLKFIYERFSENNRLKDDHSAWDEFGQYLWSSLKRRIPPSDEFFLGWESRNRARP